MNINTRDLDFVKFNGQEMAFVNFNNQTIYEAWKKLILNGVSPLTLPKCKDTKLINYKIEGNSISKSRLPKEYQEVEYIESTGTQYIDTGVKPNQDTSVELDGSIDGYGIFFGVRTSTTEGVSTIQGLSSGTWAMGYNNSSVAFGTKDSNRHVWFKNKNLQYMDGELKYNYTYANFTAMGNAYLFAYNNNGTIGYVINGRVRVYSCKIWATADSMLVRYMIPAKRNSDGVVGMYDIMNDVFLTNQGTGDFEYGSEIPDSREAYYYVDGLVEKVGTRSAGNKNLFNGC